MKTLSMHQLHRVARRLQIRVTVGRCSCSFPDRRTIVLGQRHVNVPHVLAHEIAHIIGNMGRASQKYYWKGTRRSQYSLALRCEENIADLVADQVTGTKRTEPGWHPVTGRTLYYCQQKAAIVVARILRAEKESK